MDSLITITFWNVALLGLLLLLQPLARVLSIGVTYALSNFDQRVEEGVLARRLAMVCSNQVEALALWVPVVVIMPALTPGLAHPHIATIALVFLLARLAYAAVSLAGLAVLRSGAWIVGFVAWGYLAWIAARAVA